MRKIIEKILSESINVKEEFVLENIEDIIKFADKIVTAFTNDRKLMLCGNGGSAADAQHLAAEFVNRFVLERPPLPAIALTTDTSILTSIGNDYSFDYVFSKQVKALGMERDVLLVISTSGNSPNVLAAAKAAKQEGIYVVGFAGCSGGELSNLADLPMVVKSDSTARIQETHILVGHIVCQLVDYMLFQQGSSDD